MINSRLSRCRARRSGTAFSWVSLTKVEARKYFLFTEKFPFIENKELLLDFVITLRCKHQRFPEKLHHRLPKDLLTQSKM